MKNKTKPPAWGGARKGAGPKPKPPRIDSHGNLIFNVKHLSRERKAELMELLREFWNERYMPAALDLDILNRAPSRQTVKE